MLESTPTKTMMKVSAERGATFTSFRISAPIRPDSSATPTPSMATKITATTLNPAKLSTSDVKRKRMPFSESRLSILVVSVLISTCSWTGARAPGATSTFWLPPSIWSVRG